MNIAFIRKAVEATKEELKPQFHFLEVYLFGSYASGQEKPDSDIDLCFLSQRGIDPWFAQIQIRRAIFPKLKNSLDVLVYDSSTFWERAGSKSSMEHEISTNGIKI